MITHSGLPVPETDMPVLIKSSIIWWKTRIRNRLIPFLYLPGDLEPIPKFNFFIYMLRL